MTHPAWPWLRYGLFSLSLLAFGLTVALLLAEESWDRANQPQPTPLHAFMVGSIGTELAPLPVFAALPVIFPEEFQPITSYFKSLGLADPQAGDWIDQYGFIRSDVAPEPKPSAGLPVGFTLSHHRPLSGAPSPVPFVGLACGACHSAELRTDPNARGSIHYGVGNPTLNLLAFSEAVRGLLVRRKDPADPQSDYVLTLDAVEDANGKKLEPLERAMCYLWLQGARGETIDYQKVVDTPYEPHQLLDARFMMAGPARTQPFRSLVRIHLDRPGWWSGGHQMDQGFSKIPVVFHQHRNYHGDWAQFDGSVRSPVARSTLAASTAGANVNNLSLPDLAKNIHLAADYTLELAPQSWAATFPTANVPTAADTAAGATVYNQYCFECHGRPAADRKWSGEGAAKFGSIIPLAEIRTDGDRLQFRHNTEVPRIVTEKFTTGFRKDHPLKFEFDDVRYTDGYYAAPISGAYLRAPYLHNASVLTMAELIGLKKRRDLFYRGRNAYDLEGVGFASPPMRDDRKPLDKNYYFVFDTAVRGNSNKGHEYPAWAFQNADPSPEQKESLRVLLEYLKGL